MTLEEMFYRLDSSYQGMMKEQEQIKQTEALLTSKISEALHQMYAEDIYRLSAEGYRLLDEMIVYAADDLAVKACNIFNDHTE